MFSLEWCEFCWAVRRLFGRLQKLLLTHHVAFDASVHDDPLGFLPGWLHPR